MTRIAALPAVAIAAALLAASPAHAQENSEVQSAQGQPYSVDTTQVAVLLDDPQAAAILERLIPTVYGNEMFQTMGRSQTLKAIQQYEPAVLTDEKLAEIQAEFAKLFSKG